MSKIRKLSAELEYIAMSELNESPKRLESDLAAFKEWIAKTPHLNPRLDDQFLVTFLRGCKFSLEKAKEKLDAFYSCRKMVPELFSNRQVSEKMIKLIKSGTMLRLPQTDGPTGPRIYFGKVAALPQGFNVCDIFKWGAMIQDIGMCEDDNLTISGAMYIYDLEGFTMQHLQHFTPMVLKKTAIVWQNASPLRIKGLHVFNNSPIFSALINMVRGFLSEKLKPRLTSTDKLDPIFDIVPRKLLPKEYGGEAGTIDEITDGMVKKIKEYAKFFEDDINYGTNEKLRVGKSRSAEKFFGLDGSFRKLEID